MRFTQELLSLLWLIGCQVSSGQLQDSSSADLLFSKIYNSLHSSVVPPKVNGSLNVTFDMSIAQLLALDQVKQSISLLIWRVEEWPDTRLAWQGRVFDGNVTFNTISQIMVANKRVWRPDLVVYNEIRKTTTDLSLYLAAISSNGTVHLTIPEVMEVSCEINIEFFPYDKQTCSVKVGSWTMNGLELNLLNKSKSAQLGNFDEDNEYCLIGAPLTRNLVQYPCCKVQYPDITYQIILQRKPLFYEINLIVPCIFILIVGLFGFCLPAESGERVSLSVTVLLALSVFLQLASEHTPTQSDCVPLLSRYFMAAIAMSSLCVLGSILTLALHFRGKQDRPMGARTEQFFKVLCRILRCLGFESAKAKPTASYEANVSIECEASSQWKELPLPETLPTSELLELVGRINSALEDIRLALTQSRFIRLQERRWEEAAQAADRLMLIASLIAFAALMIVIIANRPADAVNAATDCAKMRAAFAATI